MKITIQKDFRNLKANTEYNFDMSEKGFVTVVGDNGCGKSSILQALRGYKNDNKTNSLYERDFQELASNINVEHDYEKIFHLDRIKDNGSDMNVAYDASEYLSSGGYQTRHSSHGQSSMYYLDNFMKKALPNAVPNKTLVVFDEVDSGFSISFMGRYFNLIKAIIEKYNCHFLVISHNPFLISQSEMVYDISKNAMVSGADFIKEKTGFKIEQLW